MSVLYALRVVEQLIEDLCGDAERAKRYREFRHSISKNGNFHLAAVRLPCIQPDIDRLVLFSNELEPEDALASRVQAVRLLLAMHGTLSAVIASGKAFDSVPVAAQRSDNPPSKETPK